MDEQSLIYLAEFCRYLIAVTLVFAALGKGYVFAEASDNLSDTLTALRLPGHWNVWCTGALIALEATFGLGCLLNPEISFWMMLGAGALIFVFTLILGALLLQGRMISCHCFGASKATLSVYDVVRNLTLLLACSFYLYVHFIIGLSYAIDVVGSVFMFCAALIAFQIVVNLKEIKLLLFYPLERLNREPG